MNEDIATKVALLEYRDGLRERQLADMDRKLDELLALKNRGAGAFWLVAALFGGGLVTTFISIMQWIKS